MSVLDVDRIDRIPLGSGDVYAREDRKGLGQDSEGRRDVLVLVDVTHGIEVFYADRRGDQTVT